MVYSAGLCSLLFVRLRMPDCKRNMGLQANGWKVDEEARPAEPPTVVLLDFNSVTPPAACPIYGVTNELRDRPPLLSEGRLVQRDELAPGFFRVGHVVDRSLGIMRHIRNAPAVLG